MYQSGDFGPSMTVASICNGPFCKQSPERSVTYYIFIFWVESDPPGQLGDWVSAEILRKFCPETTPE